MHQTSLVWHTSKHLSLDRSTHRQDKSLGQIYLFQVGLRPCTCAMVVNSETVLGMHIAEYRIYMSSVNEEFIACINTGIQTENCQTGLTCNRVRTRRLHVRVAWIAKSLFHRHLHGPSRGSSCPPIQFDISCHHQPGGKHRPQYLGSHLYQTYSCGTWLLFRRVESHSINYTVYRNRLSCQGG